MTTYPKVLLLKPLNAPKNDWWQVAERVLVKCDLHPLGRFHIPAGFNTDFASLLQLLWWFIPPHGLTAMPCLVHDFMYECRKFDYSRLEADVFWYNLMKQAGVPRWQRALMFGYVRLLGWITWNQFRRQKSK